MLTIAQLKKEARAEMKAAAKALKKSQTFETMSAFARAASVLPNSTKASDIPQIPGPVSGKAQRLIAALIDGEAVAATDSHVLVVEWRRMPTYPVFKVLDAQQILRQHRAAHATPREYMAA